MRHNVTDVIEHDGEWYLCVNSDYCSECSLINTECHGGMKSDIAERVFGVCGRSRRPDNTNVIFKKLSKIGKPISINGSEYQLLDIKGMDCVDCVFKTNGLCEFPAEEAEPGCDCGSNGVYVKIKNQKTMEEKKLNLKPFDIQKAREGKPVCTRDGRKARIICFDRKFIYNGQNYCIVALISEAPHNEVVYSYTKDGLYNPGKIHERDLMMLSEKKSGWLVIRKDAELYESEEDAKNICTNDNYVPVKVEFEI